MRFHCVLVALIVARIGFGGELVDDFSAGGWKPANAKAPATVEAKKGSLLLTDLPGGKVDWGTSCAKRYAKVDLAETPYLVIEVGPLTGGYEVKLSGGKQWPKSKVASGDKPGLVVIDMTKIPEWKTGAGSLNVYLYTMGDGSKVEYKFVKFTGTLSAQEEEAAKKPALPKRRKKTPKRAK
jgi:hypothetical protein